MCYYVDGFEGVIMDGLNTSSDPFMDAWRETVYEMTAPVNNNPELLWVFVGAIICMFVGFVLVFTGMILWQRGRYHD